MSWIEEVDTKVPVVLIGNKADVFKEEQKNGSEKE